MRALVIGLGQDGRLMSEKLIAEGVEFRVIMRRSSFSVSLVSNYGIPVENILTRLIISADMLEDLHQDFAFTHIFNFAANSFVQESNDHFRDYIQANSFITWELLKFVRRMPEIWMMQPLSSEILVDTPRSEADISRCVAPRNAYGLSKLIDMHSCSIERNLLGLQIFSPIVFNHESRLRPAQFFTRKVLAFLRTEFRKTQELRIFNAASVRDWGSAPEYIDIFLQAARSRLCGSPLLGTGFGLSVEAFVDHALSWLDMDNVKWQENGLLRWRGSDWQITEVNRDLKDASRVVVANRDAVEGAFGCAPMIFGTELVRQLALDVI
jgi:GDPmannose 4,6-dehydratase